MRRHSSQTVHSVADLKRKFMRYIRKYNKVPKTLK